MFERNQKARSTGRLDHDVLDAEQLTDGSPEIPRLPAAK
jgi:hypothetical protein